MNWDDQKVTSIDLVTNDVVMNDENISSLFVNFLESFRIESTFIYREKLMNNLNQNILSLKIKMEHLSLFDEVLFQELQKRPERLIGLFEKAVIEKYNLSGFQLELISNGNLVLIRDMDASKTNRIIRMKGIVVSTSTIITKPKSVFILCKNCLSSKSVTNFIPRNCDNSECPIDPYVVLPEKSSVVDYQYVKIQEHFEDIPVGEMPRHFTLVFEKKMVNTVIPGSKITITGIFCIKEGSTNFAFVKVIGLEEVGVKNIKSFTEEEEEKFRAMAKEGIYEQIWKSIAPSIFGMEDIKRALSCMLFGGTRRILRDGVCLRGDINILLLGDPGVAKSQLLKFMESVSPVGVYTSGKGSSAAGLTASVIRDHSGDFYLEGGALVLADNGICCIDEFDKMDETDRVAIHEAMEQQTISIAKAGITTVLNTRASILAAANPVYGRYDDLKTPGDNIEFSTTILSRFDCIFIIKDKHNKEADEKLAKHVLGVHTGMEERGDIIPMETLRRYVQYAKSRVFPTLSDKARLRLSKYYVNTRSDVKSWEGTQHERSAIPITVRQLEAIIRISESLAKMELSEVCDENHVNEAIRLFRVSTLDAVRNGHNLEGMTRVELVKEIDKICEEIKKILPVGSAKAYNSLKMSLSQYEEGKVLRAVDYMVKQEKLALRDMGRVIMRLP